MPYHVKERKTASKHISCVLLRKNKPPVARESLVLRTETTCFLGCWHGVGFILPSIGTADRRDPLATLLLFLLGG